MLIRLFAVLLVGALAGCSFVGSDKESEDSEVTSEGVDPSEDPFGALGALAKIGSELEELQAELESAVAVETLHFNDLIAALPEEVDGWTASEPEGSTNQMGDFQVSTAQRTYTKDDASVTVQIDDWAFHQALYVPFMMAAKFSQESTSGYNKGITVGEDPGREEFNTKQNSGERSVLFHKRYHVSIKVRNAPPETFDAFWDAIDKDKLPAPEKN